MFADTRAVLRDVAALVRPAPKLTIPEAAARVVKVNGGPFYDPEFTHYIREPAECITSRAYEAVVFVGPAQTGKTLGLVDNTLAYVITTNPQDVMVIQTSKDQARDFSMRRIDRMHRNSPLVGRCLASGDSADNTFDKVYRSGMILSIVWPSKNITAGKAIPIVIVTDYDRIKDDAGGEGSLFDVLLPRTRTFKSRGIVVVESSPSRDVLKPDWKPETPHAAPPTKGILGLFGSGDRRRHYCQCQHCGEYWMPDPSPEGMHIPAEGDEYERLEQIGLPCTNCGTLNTVADETAVKASFTWLREGQSIDRDGVITGEGRRSKIASFWMPGYAAKYESWTGLASKLMRAESQFERTGEEEALEAVVNTGFGSPHLRKAMRSETTAKDLQAKAEAASELRPEARGVVPLGARCLITTIDNQKHSFVVQVHAFGVGAQVWIVDRYEITVSDARQVDGEPTVIAPAQYVEDWATLRERVIERKYPTADGRMMESKVVGQDLHGLDGVSSNAYAFWREMRKAQLASMLKTGRYWLVRGGSYKDAATCKQSIPDQSVPGKKGVQPGDVPVLTLNTTKLKDTIAARLKQIEPGDGHIHLPAWADESWFAEMVAEVRTEKGWERVSKRNEAIDLLVYALGLWHHIGGVRIDWDNPPSWAEEWESNDLIDGGERKKPTGVHPMFTSQGQSDAWQ